MRNIRLIEDRRRPQLQVDSPLQTALTIAFGALIVVGLALAAPVVRAAASWYW